MAKIEVVIEGDQVSAVRNLHRAGGTGYTGVSGRLRMGSNGAVRESAQVELGIDPPAGVAPGVGAGEELPPTAALFLEHLTAPADDRHPGFTLGHPGPAGLTSEHERRRRNDRHERH